MLAKLSLLAVFASLAAAISFETPSGWTSGSTQTIEYNTDPTDNYVNIYLRNKIFNNDFAIANNVSPNGGSVTLNLPTLEPDAHYALVATPVSDSTKTLFSTGEFYIGGPITSSSSVSTSSVASSGGSSVVTVTTSTSVASGSSSSSSTGFGVTVTSTSQSGSVTGSASGTGSRSGTNSGSNSSPSPSSTGGSSGAASHSASVAGALLAAVAGVAVAAF